MNKGTFLLSCCSTADLPKAYFDEHEIPYVCFHYTMDGKEYPDDLGQTMPFDEFYRIMETTMPVTSQVNCDQYVRFFTPLLEQGHDILHISLSGGLSGSVNSAYMAKNELEEKFPDRKLYIVDSLGASSGYGLLVDAVRGLRDSGATIDEAFQWVEDNKLTVHHWFFSTDLTSYRRGGRISGTAAVVGTMLNICPLLNMDSNGKLIPRKKIRTKRKVIEEIVRMMEQHAEGGPEYAGKCFISNSACYEDARQVADMVEAKFPHLNGKVMINSIGTVIGAHTGPGTVALFFFGDKRVD